MILSKQSSAQGWVERSDTYQLHVVEVMGFAWLNPSHGLTANNAA
jgi:hypothetical protein